MLGCLFVALISLALAAVTWYNLNRPRRARMAERELTLEDVFKAVDQEGGCAPDCCQFHIEGWALLVEEIKQLREARMRVVRANPGDLVVITFPERLSDAQAQRLREEWRAITNTRAVVLDGGASVEAVIGTGRYTDVEDGTPI